MKHFSLAIIASALFAFGTMSTASAHAAPAIPTSYIAHVHITRVDASTGKVMVVSDAVVSTVDGEAAPYKVVDDIPYVSQITSTVNAKGKKIGEKKQKSHVETGLVVNVTPTTMPNGKVKVDYSVDFSTLVSMQQLTSNGDTIELPTVDEQNSHGSAVVGVGSPLTLKAGDKVVTITVNKA